MKLSSHSWAALIRRGVGLGLGAFLILVGFSVASGQAETQREAVEATAPASGVAIAAVAPRAPIGTIDSAGTSAGAIVVRGWALDPDTGASIAVHFYVDGRWGGATTAGLSRPDVGAAFGLGDNHGYEETIPATAGAHTVCAYGIDSDGGTNALLACRTVTVLGREPVGSLDSVGNATDAIVVRGWALNPYATAAISVHVYVDGRWGAATTADLSRPDVGTAFGLGDDHGFALTIPAGSGPHSVCAYAIDPNGGANPLLCCRTVTVMNRAPIGAIDGVETSSGAITVRGWALDPDTTAQIVVNFYVDGYSGRIAGGLGGGIDPNATTTASLWRSDVGVAYGLGNNHGYDLIMAARAGVHKVCAYGIDANDGTNLLLACRTVTVTNRAPIGTVDDVETSDGAISVRGWALDPDDPTDFLTVAFYVDGNWGGDIGAYLSRPDVGAALGMGANHGYIKIIPASAGSHTVCAYGIDSVGGSNPLLSCRTVTVRVKSRLVLSPATRTMTAGGSQAYTARGFDADNKALGDVTSSTTFTVDGKASACSGSTCSPTAVGNHTVTGTDGAATGTAALHVDAVGAVGHAAYGWGANGGGQLGDGTTTDRTVLVQAGAGADWASVATGLDHTVAIKTDGTLWQWGGASGPRPVQVGIDTHWGSVSFSAAHVLVVKTDGTLWAWGSDDYGQLGDILTDGALLPSQVAPVPVGTGTDTDWAAAAAGGAHSLAIKTDGTLWAWGCGLSGQLGIDVGRTASPEQVGTDTHWASVAAGDNHTAAIKTDGTLWTWGEDANGELGNGTTTWGSTHAYWAPAQVGTDTHWASVAPGKGYTLAIKTDGTLWAWGYAIFGVGGTQQDYRVPGQIGTDTHWASVSAGPMHSVAVKTDGTLWAWGADGSGDPPGSPSFPHWTPVQVGTDTGWASAVAGDLFTIALRS